STSSPTTKPSAPSAPSKSSSAAPADAGAPSTAWPTSPSSSPTCRPPPNGTSANSTPSAPCSAATPGYQPPSNPASSQPAFHTTTSRRRLVNSYGYPLCKCSLSVTGHLTRMLCAAKRQTCLLARRPDVIAVSAGAAGVTPAPLRLG